MLNVIQFLEALARNPRGLEGDGMAEGFRSMTPGVRAALVANDPAALAAAVGATAVFVCLIEAPDGEEPLPGEQPADGEDEPVVPDTQAA